MPLLTQPPFTPAALASTLAAPTLTAPGPNTTEGIRLASKATAPLVPPTAIAIARHVTRVRWHAVAPASGALLAREAATRDPNGR